jgi:hypothetical protein
VASNNQVRKVARSAKTRCKPGKWKDLKRAQAALERLERDHPLNALGMRTYWCKACQHFHVGRAATNG